MEGDAGGLRAGGDGVEETLLAGKVRPGKTLGLGSGTLACQGDCQFNFDGCSANPVCGNEEIEGTEECDGSNLAELELEALPVFDGLAAAGERLYLCTKYGKLTCFVGR